MNPHSLSRDSSNIRFHFGTDGPIPCRARSGDVIRIETVDASNGQLRPGRTAPFDRNRVNPVTGPVYVEEAMPGDLLRVRVLQIDLEPSAYVWVRPGLGFRTGAVREAEIRPVSLSFGRNEAEFLGRLTFPLHPHVGTLGVAPQEGPIESKWPGFHGGNLDCTAARPAASVWLPVFQPGALFALGDVHAAMGEGEVGGTGVEAEATVTVELSVHRPTFGLLGPVIETLGALYLFGHGESTDEAADAAVQRGVKLMRALHGISTEEAYMLLSMTADLRYCQVALPRVGIALRIPRRLAGRQPLAEWPVQV